MQTMEYAINPDKVPAGKVLDTFIEVLWVQKGKSFMADLDAQPPQVIAGTESYDAPDYSTDPVVSGTLLATLPYYIIEKDAERSEQVRIVFPDPTPGGMEYQAYGDTAALATCRDFLKMAIQHQRGE